MNSARAARGGAGADAILPAMRRPFFLAVIALAGGCNDPANDLDPDGKYRPDPLTITTSTDTPLAYPEGPYSVAKGSIIPNVQLPGYPNAQADSSALTTIALSDFYNPHAGDPAYKPQSPDADDRLFPPGSPYGAGEKKPVALVIDIASVWCGPCNEEAKTLLPGLHAKYKPCGGDILFQLVESASPGTPATESNLKTWTKVYKVDYPATIDPARQLSALYPTGSFPDAAVVDTRTMKIIEVIQGVPTDAFWASYEALLDQACLGK